MINLHGYLNFLFVLFGSVFKVGTSAILIILFEGLCHRKIIVVLYVIFHDECHMIMKVPIGFTLLSKSTNANFFLKHYC